MAYYVYMMSSRTGILYAGVTNDLGRRVAEHRSKQAPGFTRRYNVTKLVYFEATDDIDAAIAREKQIKGYRRSKKTALIEADNPHWLDLSEGWSR